MSSSFRPGRTATTTRWLLLAGGFSVMLGACAESVAPPQNEIASSPAVMSARGGNAPIADEYIVVFKDNVSDVRGKALGLVRQGVQRNIYTKAIKGFSAHMSAAEARRIAADPSVAYVEQDQEVSISGSQSNATWGLDRIDQSALPLNGSYSWNTDGTGVNVYIIDTGIRSTHSQFGGRASGVFSAIADAYGPTGCHWHGTHVAGTVGGASVGVAKNARLYSVRVLDCNGSGTVSGVIAGVDWVASNRALPAVANMSVGGGYSQALNDAVTRAIGTGVTFVVAAGNNASDACTYSPAATPAAITVGATTSADAQASYSNWGGCLDMMAPGTSIYSTWNTDDNSMGTASGTSMATPHVAGAAALYLSANPGASPAAVAAALTGNATAGALGGLGSGTPNKLLRVNGSGGTVTPAPAPAPPPPPPPAANTPPVPSFSVSCSKGRCNFDGSATKDDGALASFAWSFGDGTSAISNASPYASHTYTQKGNYTVSVSLTVTDAGGLKATVSKSVSIKNNGR